MGQVYDHKTYKSFLAELCGTERGMLTRLSEAAGCQKSYLSSCLKSKTHLTQDHLYGISEYLHLDESERDCLFLMLEKEKAGSPALRRHLEDKIKKMVREALRLKNQQKDAVIVSEPRNAVDLGFYYGSWMGTAIHMLTSVSEFQTVAAISKRLGIPAELCTAMLSQLEAQQLVKRQGTHYKWDSANLHLADNSAWIANHHQNWRLRAIENVQKRDEEAVHYSAVQSMSAEDFEKLKKKIVQFIKEFNTIADPSSPEDAFTLSLDFFRI